MNEFDELIELPQDTVEQMSDTAQNNTHELLVDTETFNVSIRAKVESCIEYKEDKKSGVSYPVGILSQSAIDNFINDIPIIAHPSLGIPYEYNYQTGLWKGITAPLHVYIDRNYLENWFYNETKTSNAVFNDRKRLAQDLANYKTLEGENTPITRNPNPNKILFKNGAYDFETNTIAEPLMEDYHTVQLPYNLVPTNERTIVEDWLEWIVGESLQTVMELIGYCFYRDYRFATVAYFINASTQESGSNGKSMFLEYLTHVLGGNDNVSSVSLADLTNGKNQFIASNLEHKLANIEKDSGLKYISDTGKIKTLTGNDTFTVERKNENAHQMKNYAKMMFSSNALPDFSDDSFGMKRRLIIVPFVKDFKDGKHSEEKEFYNSQRNEREDYNRETIGKFVWNCLQAFRSILTDKERRNQNNPFYVSDNASREKEQYIHDNDIALRFLSDNNLKITKDYKNQESWILQSEIKAMFKVWAQENESDMKVNNFIKRLKAKGALPERKRYAVNHGIFKNPQNVLTGIEKVVE